MSIKGLDSFLDVFEIIKNPAKYESKIKELQSVTAQYKEAVEAVVALAGVNDYVLSIKDRGVFECPTIDTTPHFVHSFYASGNLAGRSVATLTPTL